MRTKKVTYTVKTKSKVKPNRRNCFTWFLFYKFDTPRAMIEFTSLKPEYEIDTIKGGIYG